MNFENIPAVQCTRPANLNKFFANYFKDVIEMSNVTRCLVLVAAMASGAGCAPYVCAQEMKYDSDSISGLGARNIGSATMSGRIAALTAVKENGPDCGVRRSR
jgi:hypothetical protein